WLDHSLTPTARQPLVGVGQNTPHLQGRLRTLFLRRGLGPDRRGRGDPHVLLCLQGRLACCRPCPGALPFVKNRSVLRPGRRPRTRPPLDGERRLGRNQHLCASALEGQGLYGYLEPVPCCDRGHHEQPQLGVFTYQGQIESRRVGQQNVGPLQLGRGHPQPAILHLQPKTPAGPLRGAHRHGASRRGERRGVFQQLCQQPHRVRADVTTQRRTRHRSDTYTRVVLDLTGRGPHHLVQLDRFSSATCRGIPAQQHQVLGVTS